MLIRIYHDNSKDDRKFEKTIGYSNNLRFAGMSSYRLYTVEAELKSERADIGRLVGEVAELRKEVSAVKARLAGMPGHSGRITAIS
jgi:hypothetical protein